MSSREAVVVSCARTAIAKAYRGSFNNTQPLALAAHAISYAVQTVSIAQSRDLLEKGVVRKFCAADEVAQVWLAFVVRRSSRLSPLVRWSPKPCSRRWT